MKKIDFKKYKYNTLFYFILFTVIIIFAVWLSLTLFLEEGYKDTKKANIIHTGNKVAQLINNEENIERTAIAANEQGINVELLNIVYGEDGAIDAITVNYPLYHRDYSTEEEKSAIGRLITALGNDKEFYCVYENNSYFYIAKTNAETSENTYIYITSSIGNIREAIEVIRRQLLFVTFIVCLLGLCLAIYISNKLTYPISEMAATAKRWADGDNDAVFTANSYTELNELAETMNYAKEKEKEAGRLQRDLIANVSHDLKTPITMIKAYAEMIQDISGDNKEKRIENTQVIIDEADRLALLVNDILDLSKLQSGVDNLNVTAVNISELVEITIEHFRKYMENDGYIIKSEIEDDLFSEVDEAKITRVIYNLLGNSLNYTGDDKTVCVYLHKKEGNKILLEIIDSGKGISEDKMKTIWEKYYRFSETHKRSIKGTGLGLSIVKTILDEHGLKYGVVSKQGVGSNFFVEFRGMDNE